MGNKFVKVIFEKPHYVAISSITDVYVIGDEVRIKLKDDREYTIYVITSDDPSAALDMVIRELQ